MAPASLEATMCVFVGLPFKPFEHVVGFESQFGRPHRSRNRASATPTDQKQLLAGRNRFRESLAKIVDDLHFRPLLPCQRNGTRDKTDPLPLGIGSHIHENRLTILPPRPGQLRRNISRITDGRPRAIQIAAAGIVAPARCQIGGNRLVKATGRGRCRVFMISTNSLSVLPATRAFPTFSAPIVVWLRPW